jgi:hypothetical protein
VTGTQSRSAVQAGSLRVDASESSWRARGTTGINKVWGKTGSIKLKKNYRHQHYKKNNLNTSVATILFGVTKSAATFCERFSTMDEHLMRLKQQLYGKDADEKTLEWLDKQPDDIHEVCIPGKHYQGAEIASCGNPFAV